MFNSLEVKCEGAKCDVCMLSNMILVNPMLVLDNSDSPSIVEQ